MNAKGGKSVEGHTQR